MRDDAGPTLKREAPVNLARRTAIFGPGGLLSIAPFHLAWFLSGLRPPSWNTTWSGSSDVDWMTAEFFVDLARASERAKFDALLVEDSSYVGMGYGGTGELDLKYAQTSPKLSPAAIVPILAAATSRVGLACTLSTSEWHPYQLARYVASVDHLSRGRMGWNIVTGGSEGSAANFGITDALSHDERYDMADEFVELAIKLWESWGPDAIVADHDTGVYADHTKVHPIDFKGKYYASRGPLNTARPPQGRPVIVQAGASPRGRRFAAKYADMIATTARTVEDWKAYRDDVRASMVAQGRDPDDCKVLFLISPTIADTDAEAYERERRSNTGVELQRQLEGSLSVWSGHLNFDLSQLDLDSPIPAELTTEGHAGVLDNWIASGKTLRELLTTSTEGYGFDLVGSPETVATKLAELMEQVGGDGFFFARGRIDRRYVSEIIDGLVPVLQRRGLARNEYTADTFRGHLREF